MNADDLKGKVADKLSELFETVITERKTHYKENEHAKISEGDIESIIKHYSNWNAIIAGGSSMIPGPYGMVAAVPEIAAIIRNQLKMIYDIGVASGKEKLLNKDLLLSVFASGLGLGTTSLVVMHGSKIIIKRTSLRFFQRIIIMLAGRVSQQLLKSMVSKYLPVVGAVAMAAWARHSTKKIGAKAKSFLKEDIEISNAEVDEVTSEAKAGSIESEKIKSMINLMRADRINHELEKKFIIPIIEGSTLSKEDKDTFHAELDKSNSFQVDFSMFHDHPEEQIMHIIDLVALSKVDDEFHPAERLYIKSVARHFGIPEDDLNDII